MLPQQFEYPQFVPDQLLTSGHLNDLFNYLEEQGRLTRTNLIGIGIVCGLDVKSNGSSVTITKGVGITSQGYLVTYPETTFTHIKPFNAVKEIIYDRFVSGSTTQIFPIDELKQTAVEEGASPINAAYLQGKVVMLFVELLAEGAKNCNPNSCDDKGVNVTLAFRPLVVSEAIAQKLGAMVTGNNTSTNNYNKLAELRMRRFDVPASNMLETANIFEAYQKVLSAVFLKSTQQTFTETFTTLSPLLFDAYPANPFAGLATKFSFLHDGSMDDEQLINMQYYYDLFADLLMAYEELRQKGMDMLSRCAPDEQLFPRHLLLGLATGSTSAYHVAYRQYFIPSPLFGCHCASVNDLRWLFARLVLMIEKFAVPAPAFTNKKRRFGDDKIRITPSKYGDVSFSKKSIPYYYKVADGSQKLYQHWCFESVRANAADRILSYHASLYNNNDAFVTSPLEYDIEAYNFFRIEGHIGKPYTHALQTILASRNKNRLPFEVIALSADIKNIRLQLAAIIRGEATDVIDDLRQNNEQSQCHFQDLESLYDTLAATLTCTLCKELQYYYAFPGSRQNNPAPASFIPQVSLLQKCAPDFRFLANTLGHEFEIFYQSFKSQPYVSADIWLANFQNSNAATTNQSNNIGLVLLYYIVKLSESLADDLSSFKLADFVTRYDDLVKVAAFIKAMLAGIKPGDNNNFNAFEDIIDHLDALIYACKKPAFETLVTDYRSRWIYVLVLQRFGYFIKFHPGIQHKAGVTAGGTFILVYHEEEIEQRQLSPNGFTAGSINTIRRNPNNFSTKNTSERFSGTANPGNDEQTKSDSGSSESTIEVNAIRKENLQLQSFSQMQKIKGFSSSKQEQALRELFATKDTGNAQLDDLVSDIADGTVIADFYLPYICCSDCPPIQFVINHKEMPDQPTIGIDKNEYCNDDKTSYRIEASPAEGTVTGEGISQDASGAFVFNPAAIDLNQQQNKTVTITYTVNGQKATLDVSVFQMPTAAFEFQNVDGSITSIQFQNFSLFAQKFAWDFGDGTTSVDKDPLHNYEQEGTFNVSLKVHNGPCTAVATQQVTLNQVQLSLIIEPNELCSDDKKSYEAKVDPPGGEITGEGISKNTAGKFVFKPAAVVLDGASSREIIITYTKDGLSKTFNVTVFQKPTAAFQFTTSPAAGNVIQFVNASQAAKGFQWDFGDGETSAEESPQHNYKLPGSFEVTLTTTNGVCTAKDTQKITIANQETQKNCLPLNNLLDDFKKLQSVDPTNFAAFREKFTSYKQVEELFASLSAIANQPKEKQVDFFDSFSVTDPFSGAKLNLQQALIKWFSSLFNDFILEVAQMRTLALTLYKILMGLVMYIVCIQKEDIAQARVNMDEVLQLIIKHLNTLTQFVATFNTANKAVLKKMLAEVIDERTRVKTNNEENAKPEYVSDLEAIIRLLTALSN